MSQMKECTALQTVLYSIYYIFLCVHSSVIVTFIYVFQYIINIEVTTIISLFAYICTYGHTMSNNRSRPLSICILYDVLIYWSIRYTSQNTETAIQLFGQPTAALTPPPLSLCFLGYIKCIVKLECFLTCCICIPHVTTSSSDCPIVFINACL